MEGCTKPQLVLLHNITGACLLLLLLLLTADCMASKLVIFSL